MVFEYHTTCINGSDPGSRIGESLPKRWAGFTAWLATGAQALHAIGGVPMFFEELFELLYRFFGFYMRVRQTLFGAKRIDER